MLAYFCGIGSFGLFSFSGIIDWTAETWKWSHSDPEVEIGADQVEEFIGDGATQGLDNVEDTLATFCTRGSEPLGILTNCNSPQIWDLVS